MRRVVSLSRGNSNLVLMVLVDATSALGVLWTLWMYECCPLVMVAPSVKTFLCFTNLQFSQLIGACASIDLSYLASLPQTTERTANYMMELGYMRSETHQIPQHMVTWLAQQSFVRVAEVERLVQAAIHGLDALQGIIMDPIFGELQECLAEILVRRIRETCSNPPTMDPVATPDMTEATPSCRAF